MKPKEKIEKMPDIVRGHEIWLEYGKRHMHVGKTVECKLFFGHNMKVDGVVDAKKVKASVFDPTNEGHDLIVGTGDGCLVIKFDPAIDGFHTVVADYDGGIFTVTDDGWQKGPKKNYENVKSSGYYRQFLKTIIPGHGIKEYELATGQELEIIPLDFRGYCVGDNISMKILYNGKPLKYANINATYKGREGDAILTKTDTEGKATFYLEKEGNWFFKVRYGDPEKGVKDQYDEKVVTSTFTVMNVQPKETKM